MTGKVKAGPCLSSGVNLVQKISWCHRNLIRMSSKGFPHGCEGTEIGLGQSLDLKVYSLGNNHFIEISYLLFLLKRYIHVLSIYVCY